MARRSFFLFALGRGQVQGTPQTCECLNLQVDRLIAVAGPEQMVEFGHLFRASTRKNLSDGHLWFSVVARPPQSRFTRVQRVRAHRTGNFGKELTMRGLLSEGADTSINTKP